MYGGVEETTDVFLTSALDSGEKSKCMFLQIRWMLEGLQRLDWTGLDWTETSCVLPEWNSDPSFTAKLLYTLNCPH